MLKPILTLSLTNDGFVIHHSDVHGVLRVWKGYTDKEAAECHPLVGLGLLRAYAAMVDEVTEYYKEATK